MSYSERKSAIAVSEDFFGPTGSKIVGVIFVLSAFLWFNNITTFSAESLSTYWHIPEKGGQNLLIQYAILLGVLSTSVCAGGMKWIRKFSLFSFPILIIVFGSLIFFVLPHQLDLGKFSGISIPGLISILGVNLAISIDLPTFFRHGKSEKAAVKALAFIQIATFLFSIGALFLGAYLYEDPTLVLDKLSILGPKKAYFLILFPTLIFLTTICANVFNIYACSVGWEVLVPKSMRKLLLGSKEYLVLGLGLTALYINPFVTSKIESVTSLVDNSEVSLCFVFITAWIIGIIFKSPAKTYEKIVFTGCWVGSSIAGLMFQNRILLIWISTTLIITLLVLLKFSLIKINKLLSK